MPLYILGITRLAINIDLWEAMRYQGQMPKLDRLLVKFCIANPNYSYRVNYFAANPRCNLLMQ
jgi:hypothetical protein